MRTTTRGLSTVSLVLLASTFGRDAGAATVGPDDFGWYSLADQDDGAVYNYVDITATGVLAASGANDTASIPLPVPFDFYGHVTGQVVANSNGFLTTDIGSNFDNSNDCPMPITPSTGGGLRVAVLHDALNTDVYYEYFDEVAADAAGFPGETDGITVIQWVGTHAGDGGLVDFEVVLFHDDMAMLMMVAADDELGSGSTMGIQEDRALTGLTYTCNTAMGVEPGVTAVQYTLAPDSDCCSPSAAAQPGCRNEACQTAVCDAASDCCDTEWDDTCAATAQTECAALCTGVVPSVRINEIRMDQVGADDDEYFELVGQPGTSLDGLSYLVLGDPPSAEIEHVTSLDGQVLPPSGVFLVGEATMTIGVPDLTTSLAFENSDTTTHLLVANLSAAVDSNLDGDEDGELDFTPWDRVLDTVVIADPGDTDLPYGPINPTGGAPACTAGPFCQQVDGAIDAAFQVFRCANAVGPFAIGNEDLATMPPTDSPGALNPCPCGNGMPDPGEDCDETVETATCDWDCTIVECGDGLPNVLAGEQCDDGGESVRCDDDCTIVECGDGVANVTAGEDCDDAGESETCNPDCSAVACGDGYVNMTAGEECDDAGESETCDADCTPVECGDGELNVTAGEECDDAGESEACDEDCTAAECGDGVLNVTAGEECDDGNTDDGDGCAADCLEEGADESTSGGVADDTAGQDETGPAMTSGPSTITDSVGDASTGGDGETDTAGLGPGDEGCSCTSGGGTGGPAPWSVLALLGLGTLGRRRLRRASPQR